MRTLQPPLPLFDTLTHHQRGTIHSYPFADDFRLATEFILSYSGSQATFNAYRRELERLLQWNAHIAHQPLKDLTRQHIESFIHFCQQPPNNWIGLKKCVRFVEKEGQRQPNPNWRPFVVTISKTARKMGKQPSVKDYLLSEKALEAIFSILGSFFNYLVQEDYIGYNPVAQIRQKSKYFRKRSTVQIRRLSELQWSYVIETAEKQANTNPHYERTLFIMNALYGMYLRISELAATKRWQPQMKHFFRDQDGLWWFRTVGKGNKERQITVSDSMLAALKRYRQSLGLPPLPSVDDNRPLIMKAKGKGPITSTRQIRLLVQSCFDAALENLLADGFVEEADQLKAATVHWLRHTGISEDVKRRPREHVRDDAGHGSSAITDRYIDVELRERHASGKKKHIKPEDL